jgi:hypothetical protein
MHSEGGHDRMSLSSEAGNPANQNFLPALTREATNCVRHVVFVIFDTGGEIYQVVG